VGPGHLIEAVSDAGPLIHLHEIRNLSLLAIFGTLHVPDVVWQETVDRGRVPEDELVGMAGLRRHALNPSTVTRFTKRHGLGLLQAGERECLYLCRKTDVPILLTDDLAVRDTCKRLGITAVGSLGVVARAFRLGQLSLADAERHLEALYSVSTLFVTRVIVDLAIEQLRHR
jgi:predicted nucleic acid-binding protein